MMHSCQFCQRAFRRKFNRDRHETVSCPKRFDDEETMDSFSDEEGGLGRRAEKYYQDDKEEDNLNEDGDEAEDDEVGDDDEDGDDGVEETDDGDIESGTENEEVDPWDKLREEVISDLNSAWEGQVQENLHQGLPKDDAQVQAANHLLPVYRKKLRHYVRWYHDLKTDPVHKKVMQTIRSFKDDDDMDYTEAVEAAISKRKYLLNSLFDLEHFPKDTELTEDNDFSYEARKRKYCENWYT